MWVYVGIEAGQLRKDLLPDHFKSLASALQAWLDADDNFKGFHGCFALRRLGNKTYVKLMGQMNYLEFTDDKISLDYRHYTPEGDLK